MSLFVTWLSLREAAILVDQQGVTGKTSYKSIHVPLDFSFYCRKLGPLWLDAELRFGFHQHLSLQRSFNLRVIMCLWNPTSFGSSSAKVMRKRKMFIEKNWVISVHWINIDSDIISEQSTTFIPSMILTKKKPWVYLDKMNEPMDYNPARTGTITFIYNVLALEKDKGTLWNHSSDLCVQDTRLVTISNEDSNMW